MHMKNTSYLFCKTNNNNNNNDDDDIFSALFKIMADVQIR